MAKNNIISVYCFGKEIGRLGFDENQVKSFFQYNPDFFKNDFLNLFPNTSLVKKTNNTQVFSSYNNETFKGLPPFIADSLPDVFGNIVFKTWLEANNKNFKQISVLEQLAYVSNRGMGALEYQPSIEIASNNSINLDEITSLLKEVLDTKKEVKASALNSDALLNIFKIGTSAGGVRPKILIAENKQTGQIIPGDIEFSNDYHHYLVKLSLEEELGYNKEMVEYAYYLHAKFLGIEMMPSHLIDNKHFCTTRYDRQEGGKKHVLTASGLTGWDFKEASVSSYENLFDLALYLKVPQKDIEQLYKRMVFNLVFCNADDHLKNHSFIFNEHKNIWNIAPAYDITYPFNPLFNYKRMSRALSINNKRIDISLKDILLIAEKYTVKNPKSIISNTLDSISVWEKTSIELGISTIVIDSIKKEFNLLINS